MKIKALNAFLAYDGAKPVIAKRGSVHEVSPTLANDLVDCGLAEFLEEQSAEKKAVRKPSTRKAAKVEK